MTGIAIVIAVVVALVLAVMLIRVVNQYERGVLSRLGHVIGIREPGLHSDANEGLLALGPQADGPHDRDIDSRG